MTDELDANILRIVEDYLIAWVHKNKRSPSDQEDIERIMALLYSAARKKVNEGVDINTKAGLTDINSFMGEVLSATVKILDGIRLDYLLTDKGLSIDGGGE